MLNVEVNLPKGVFNSMTNLEALSIDHHNDHLSFEFELKDLVKLKWLRLVQLDHDHLPIFEYALPNLEVLEISLDGRKNISIKDVSRIFQNFNSNLPKLKAFSFSCFNFSGQVSVSVDFDLKWLENLKQEIGQSTSQQTSSLRYMHLDNLLSIKGSFSSFVNLRTLGLIDDVPPKYPFSFQSKMFNRLENLRSLDLSFQHIREGVTDLFDGLVHLEKLNMNGCQMETLPDGFFSSLTSLKVLNLDCVRMPFCSGMFNRLVNLKSLNMSSNSFEINKHTLPIGLFDGLVNLENLNMSYCTIETLPDGFFSPLTSLKIIDLSGANIPIHSEQLKSMFPHIEIISKESI